MLKNDTSSRRKEVVQWILVGLPLVAIIASTFLPLKDVVQQAFIGIILIWFQASLMFGIFSEGRK